MNDDDGDGIREGQPPSPANDDLARLMDWVGLSAAFGMIVFAIVLSV